MKQMATINRNARFYLTLGLGFASAITTLTALDTIENLDSNDPFIKAGELGIAISGFGLIPWALGYSLMDDNNRNRIQPT